MGLLRGFFWLCWVAVAAYGFFSCSMWDLFPDYGHGVSDTGTPGEFLELSNTNFSNNGVFCLNFPVLPALGATACFLFADEKQRVAIVLESQVTCTPLPAACGWWDTPWSKSPGMQRRLVFLPGWWTKCCQFRADKLFAPLFESPHTRDLIQHLSFST